MRQAGVYFGTYPFWGLQTASVPVGMPTHPHPPTLDACHDGMRLRLPGPREGPGALPPGFSANLPQTRRLAPPVVFNIEYHGG